MTSDFILVFNRFQDGKTIFYEKALTQTQGRPKMTSWAQGEVIKDSVTKAFKLNIK
jgi:hypothetical protein